MGEIIRVPRWSYELTAARLFAQAATSALQEAERSLEHLDRDHPLQKRIRHSMVGTRRLEAELQAEIEALPKGGRKDGAATA